MPIRADLRHFYGPDWKHITRPLILQRAGGQVTGPDETTGRYTYHGGARCELCGKPDRKTVETISLKSPKSGPADWYMLCWRETGSSWWFWSNGERSNSPIGDLFKQTPQWRKEGRARVSQVVITVAHLNHTPGDDRPENLKALCGFCHLLFDSDHHHETRSARKDGARPLLTP